VTHKVTIRYLPGIVAKMFVNFNSRLFNIEYVMNDEERNIFLDLLCVEVNDGGNNAVGPFTVLDVNVDIDGGDFPTGGGF
jgi:hypothetical protein